MRTATKLNRSLSVVMAIGYVMNACFEDNQPASVLKVLAFLVIPMACIWQGDLLGSYTGPTLRGYINKTPGWIVSFGGWFYMVGVPGIIFLLKFFAS